MKDYQKGKIIHASVYIAPQTELIEVYEEGLLCLSGDAINIGDPGFGGFGSDEAFNGNGVGNPGFGGFGPETDF